MGRSAQKSQALIYLPSNLRKALKAKAESTGRSMSDLVAEALRKVNLLDLEKTPKPEIDKKAIETFCRVHGVATFSLFGSILRDDFGEKSDVDVLIDPEKGKSYRIEEYLVMQEELEKMFMRRVDLVNKKVFMNHENELRKHEILSTAQIIVSVGAGDTK